MPEDSDLLAQLVEEITARLRQGQLPEIERDYAARYPPLAERNRALFPTLMLLEGMAQGGPVTTPPPSPTAHLTPQAEFGAYRIERVIGRGGMGVVYEAVHQSLQRRVALKLLSAATLEGGGLERFLREAQTAAGLHHTNIVPVFDLGQVGGVPFYAMQLIAGRGLDLVLKEQTASSAADQLTTAPGRAAPVAGPAPAGGTAAALVAAEPGAGGPGSGECAGDNGRAGGGLIYDARLQLPSPILSANTVPGPASRMSNQTTPRVARTPALPRTFPAR
jgi:hypothetical protein